jgi:uncharacterized protein (DUF1499 family)
LEETKTSSRVLLVTAVVLLVILITGPLGYKFGLVPLQPSILSLPIAAVGGLLVFVVGLVYLVIALRGGLIKDRNQIIIALVLGSIPFLVVGPQIVAAGDVPPIHDISTDVENPPTFVALLPDRKDAPNGFEYGTEMMSAEELGEATRTAYPGVQPIESSLSVADAVARAKETVLGMGLEVIATDVEAGTVEATATTLWFGFKDDFVVRVTPSAGGSRVDARSMSRVGQSDIGTNAARILAFTESF